jgi:predicted glutamine amidotransferase
MCRIFYNPGKGINYAHKDIFEFLERLERAQGGDGNGIFQMRNEKLDKSATEMPDKIELKGEFLFHTRRATNGKVADYNTQPFEGKRYVMVHNGIFSSVESYARLLGFKGSTDKYSDSYMMHWIMEKVGLLNFYIALSEKVYGVVVAYDK